MLELSEARKILGESYQIDDESLRDLLRKLDQAAQFAMAVMGKSVSGRGSLDG